MQAVPQKQVNKDHWPAIHWAGDESAFAHCVTNTAHVYEAKDAFAGEGTERGATWASGYQRGAMRHQSKYSMLHKVIHAGPSGSLRVHCGLSASSS